MTKSPLFLATALLALLLGVPASSARSSAPSQSLTYAYVPFQQLDPQRVSDGKDIAGQDLLEGLVTPNAAGTGVLPATADSWTVSPDATVYTFHIRKSARWSDGTPVTADDFEWSYKRLLTPSTAAIDKLNGSSSYPSDLGIRNAIAYQLGQVTDWSKVGVKALDASRLRITLDAPNASFLLEMALPAMVALPEKNVTDFPFDWQTTAHWVGNGPFVIQSWTPNSDMVLVPNPDYWDRGSVHLDRLTIATSVSSDDVARSQYDSGTLDVAHVSGPQAFANDPATAGALRSLHNYSIVFFGLIPSRNRAIADVRVRQAIALAIDRQATTKAIPGILSPATSLVPSTLPGYDRSVAISGGVADARRLLAAAGYPGGKGFPTLTVMTSHDDPIVAAALRSLRRNLGIRAVQDIEPDSVRDAKEHEVQPKSFAGFFATGYAGILSWRPWVSDYYPPSQAELLSLTPDDYIHYQVLQAKGTAQALATATAFLEAHASPETRRFAALAAEADSTADPARAIALYKRAAAIRQATYEFIPLVYGDLDYLIRPGINGIHLWPGFFTISFKGVSVG